MQMKSVIAEVRSNPKQYRLLSIFFW